MRVVVTGGNRGIGLGLCAAYVERGDEVIATCRRSSSELEALGVQVIEGIELTDSAAVARLEEVEGEIDALIFDPAINEDAPTLAESDPDVVAHTIDVNAIGALRVVQALAPALREGGKVMLVSIGAVALNVNVPSPGHYGYRMSKAALTSFGFGIARDLRERGIAVLLASPGPVDTEILRRAAREGRTSYDPGEAPSAAEVGRMLRDRLDELTLEESPLWQEDPSGNPVVI